MPVAVLGDATIDVAVRLAASMSAGGDREAAIRLGVGGQGANVAVRLARRGVPVRLVTALGDDQPGRWLAEQLEAEGVRVERVPPARSSLVVALIDPAGERSMLSDRAAVRLESDDLATRLAGAAWIHCSGYLLRDPVEAGPVLAAIQRLRTAGASPPRLSIAGGSADEPAPAAALREAVERLDPDLLVLGLDEARALTELPSGTGAAVVKRLAVLAPLAIVTSGATGAHAVLGGRVSIAVPGEHDPSPAIDATGAGDAYLAALLAAVLPGSWPPSTARLPEVLAVAARAGSQAARVEGAQARIPDEPPAATVAP